MSEGDNKVIHFIISTCEINPFSRSLPEMIENENAIKLIWSSSHSEMVF